MAVAALTTLTAHPQQNPQGKPQRNSHRKSQQESLFATAPRPLEKKPLPAGQPREWYITHNRRLKAMRLAIALLDSGVYHPATADNGRIRTTADRIGVHPPSDTTCRMVRALIRYGC